MNDTFFVYLHRLELMAFFSGYPLIYALCFSLQEIIHPKLNGKVKYFFFCLIPMRWWVLYILVCN